MEIIKLNIIPKGVNYCAHASLNDNGRLFRAELFEDTERYTLTGSERLRVRYRRPDNVISSFSVVNTGSNYVDISIPSDLTARAGLIYCKLRINSISCKAFYIDVENKAGGL